MENLLNGIEGRTIEDAVLAIYSLAEFFPEFSYYEIILANRKDRSDNIVLTRRDSSHYSEKISNIKDKLVSLAGETFSIEKQAQIYILYYE